MEENPSPKQGTLKYNTILQMMFCRRQGKWDEVPYVDLFFTLRNDYETRRKCKLLDTDANVVMMLEDRDTDSHCCSACRKMFKSRGRGYADVGSPRR